MHAFTYSNTTKIIFGIGAENSAVKEIQAWSDNILIVCSRGKSNVGGLVDRIEEQLIEAGVHFTELSGIKPNPEVSKVREGVRLVRERGIGFVLAIGGGSVIDTAKGIAAGACYEGDVWDLYLRKSCNNALPTGVVLTIPAAGSESSHASVITNDDTGYKMDILDLCLRPRFAILNPELTLSLSDYQTWCGVVDMLSHVMERYFGNDMDNSLTDHLCEGVMRSIIHNALILKNQSGQNLSARSQLMLASTLAHNGLLEIGREMDWASHIIGMEISAIYDTAHGATLSVITPVWAGYVYQENIPRFAQFAVRVFDVEADFANPEKTAFEGIRRMTNFFKHLGMPLTLFELGITDSDRLVEMADKAVRGGPIGGIKQLAAGDVLEIYRRAMQ